jgi:hypothetical protein
MSAYFSRCQISLKGNSADKRVVRSNVLSERDAIKLMIASLKQNDLSLSRQSLVLSQLRSGHIKWLITLGEMLLAAINGNAVWLKRSLSEFMNYNPEKMLFDISQYNFDEQFISELHQAVNFIIQNLKNEDLKQQFALLISLLDISKMNDPAVLKYLVYPSQKSKIEMIEKNNQGKISFWYYILKYGSDENENQLFLEEKIDIIEDPELLLWALSLLPAPTKYLKVKHYDLLKKVMISKDFYHRFLKLRLYQNEGAKKDFEQIDLMAKVPLFHMQRNFYHEMLNSVDSPAYPLHHLFLLNDINIPITILDRIKL